MTDTRLNGIIRAWEPASRPSPAFAKADKQSAIDLSDAPYDGIVFEMEHNPYDVAALGDSLQYLLNRKQIAGIRLEWPRPSRRSRASRPTASR
jgi:4-hydroxy-2-oxoheptanedioate aldolase